MKWPGHEILHLCGLRRHRRYRRRAQIFVSRLLSFIASLPLWSFGEILSLLFDFDGQRPGARLVVRAVLPGEKVGPLGASEVWIQEGAARMLPRCGGRRRPWRRCVGFVSAPKVRLLFVSDGLWFGIVTEHGYLANGKFALFIRNQAAKSGLCFLFLIIFCVVLYQSKYGMGNRGKMIDACLQTLVWQWEQSGILFAFWMNGRTRTTKHSLSYRINRGSNKRDGDQAIGSWVLWDGFAWSAAVSLASKLPWKCKILQLIEFYW